MVLLIGMCIIITINFVSIAYYSSSQVTNELVVNVSGRNRMLSQKICYLTEQYFRGQNVLDELNFNIKLLDESIKALKYSGNFPKMESGLLLPPTSEKTLPVVAKTESQWNIFKSNLSTITKLSIQTSTE